MKDQDLHVRYLDDFLLWAFAALAVLIMAIAVRSTPSNRPIQLGWLRGRLIPRLHLRTAATRSPIS